MAASQLISWAASQLVSESASLLRAANRASTVRLCVSTASREQISQLAEMKSKRRKLPAKFAPAVKHISAQCNTIAVSL